MRPKCQRCKKNTTAKHLAAIQELRESEAVRGDRFDGVCGPCYQTLKLPLYIDKSAEYTVRELRRTGLDWDRVLTTIRREMQAPPTPRPWAPAGVWHTLDVHELGTRGWIV